MIAKAIICRELGPPERLSFDDWGLPDPGPGEALIRIRRVGVNFPDKLIVAGGYQLKPPLPFVPGTEVAGEVKEIVPADDEPVPAHIRVGAEVMATMRTGAYATAAVVPFEAIRPMPANFSLSQAAAHPVGAQTAYVALVERGGLAAGETALILGGAGGVGLAAVQLARALGARVIATGSTPEKRAALLEAGADHAIAPADDLKRTVSDLTNGRGVDLVYDPVGGDAFDQAIRTLAWGGRILIVGFASGRIPTVSVNYALIKGISIIGVRAGEYVRQRPESGPAIHRAVDEFAAAGQLVPTIHAEVPLANAAKAMRMLERREVIGKLVLVA